MDQESTPPPVMTINRRHGTHKGSVHVKDKIVMTNVVYPTYNMCMLSLRVVLPIQLSYHSPCHCAKWQRQSQEPQPPNMLPRAHKGMIRRK